MWIFLTCYSVEAGKTLEGAIPKEKPEGRINRFDKI